MIQEQPAENSFSFRGKLCLFCSLLTSMKNPHQNQHSPGGISHYELSPAILIFDFSLGFLSLQEHSTCYIAPLKDDQKKS